MDRREAHWLATQFVASICQSVGTSGASIAAGVSCAKRQADDAVSTLTLATDKFPVAEWEIPVVNKRDSFLAAAVENDECNGGSIRKPACLDARSWKGKKVSKEDTDRYARIAQAAQLLGQQIRSRTKQILKGNVANVQVVVAGMASAEGLTCGQLRFRLLTSSMRRCTVNAAISEGIEGVDLCFRGRLGNEALELQTGKEVRICTDSIANEMLAMVRLGDGGFAVSWQRSSSGWEARGS